MSFVKFLKELALEYSLVYDKIVSIATEFV